MLKFKVPIQLRQIAQILPPINNNIFLVLLIRLFTRLFI